MIEAFLMLNVLDDVPACAGCGICCHLVVELRPGVDDVPEELVVEREGVRCMDQRGDGACVALDFATRLCTIYDRRPQTCRDFKRGEPLCRQVVAKALKDSARKGVSPS
jgi:Fe-S-cluster containining protein